MKRVISLVILVFTVILCLSACNTFQRCPAYTDVPVVVVDDDKV
ncbi:MAG TPA: hypothetical protein PKX15_04580 [Bacteroidales bacterium]|nr:hypothetical protein [Bacteroidales bacterium]